MKSTTIHLVDGCSSFRFESPRYQIETANIDLIIVTDTVDGAMIRIPLSSILYMVTGEEQPRDKYWLLEKLKKEERNGSDSNKDH